MLTVCTFNNISICTFQWNESCKMMHCFYTGRKNICTCYTTIYLFTYLFSNWLCMWVRNTSDNRELIISHLWCCWDSERMVLMILNDEEPRRTEETQKNDRLKDWRLNRYRILILCTWSVNRLIQHPHLESEVRNKM